MYCAEPATTFDHVTPRSCGGEDSEDNLLAACLRCNSTRKDQLFDKWMATKRLTPRLALLAGRFP